MQRLTSYLKYFIFSTLFFSLTAWADELIVEPEMGRAPILNAIHSARYSLDLVMYGFTDETLLNALIKQNNQGKTVKIILEEHPYKAEDENNKTIRQLNQQQISWHKTAPPFRLTHQKTLIVDDKKALVMTFNFTRSAFKNDRNFALIIDDPKRVKEIAAVFSADWNRKPIIPHSSDLLFSPDNSRHELLNLIQDANRSIKIYAQTVNDYKIVGALAKAAKKGVQVNIITSAKLRQKQADYLARAGVVVHQSKDRYIHAKVFIFDERKAIIGSINLSRASLDDNRELSVVTQDANVIKQLNQVFAQDLKATTKIAGKSKKHSFPSERTLLQMVRAVKKYLNQL